MTIPVWDKFNVNITVVLDECLKQIDDFNLAYRSSLSHSEFEDGLYEINVECNVQFNFYLTQFVTQLEILLGATSTSIFDVIFSSPRKPAKYPLSCIKNELTSSYPNIMIANGEIAGVLDGMINS